MLENFVLFFKSALIQLYVAFPLSTFILLKNIFCLWYDIANHQSNRLDVINRCFGKDTVEEILFALVS